jgi:hypothetical protein
MGPGSIPIEVWTGLGNLAIVWLTKLFNLIFWANKMPEEWRRSDMGTLAMAHGIGTPGSYSG